MTGSSSPERTLTAESMGRRLHSLRLLFRLPLLLAALWLGLLFSSMPNSATACVPVQYNYYLSVPDDDPVNVTDTVYTSNGQTYVVYNDPIPVEMNHDDGHIYDLNGHPIGYIVTIQGGENP